MVHPVSSPKSALVNAPAQLLFLFSGHIFVDIFSGEKVSHNGILFL
jgi:hypothetical protein